LIVPKLVKTWLMKRRKTIKGCELGQFNRP
jgi:hypothetical protein